MASHTHTHIHTVTQSFMEDQSRAQKRSSTDTVTYRISFTCPRSTRTHTSSFRNSQITLLSVCMYRMCARDEAPGMNDTTYTHTHTHTHTHTQTHPHTHTHTHTHTHMHAHTHSYTKACCVFGETNRTLFL